MRVKPNKVFVSAYRSGKTPEVNHYNHEKAMKLLNDEGIQFQVVVGVYKGEKELTFLLSASDATEHFDNLEMALRLGLLFDQESILEVHNDDGAVLHFMDGTAKNLGSFFEVTKAEALEVDHTYEPVSNRYFVVR